MKPLLFRIPTVDDRSIRVQEDNDVSFYDRLHYHPEIQLTLIKQGEGTLLVGNRIDRFGPYDLLLIGDNLTHVLRNHSDNYQPGTKRRSVAYSIFFRKETLQHTLFSLPELGPVNQLLQEAKHGVRIRLQEGNAITGQMESLPQLRPFEQLMVLLTTLDFLATHPQREILSTMTYERPRRPDDHQRLDQVFGYLLEQYASPITLEAVADVANLTPGAFCRFFKIHTRKTFSGVLNEIRIENACRLLHQSNQSISQIALVCGYTSLSNFNRQFKAITSLTPGQYLKTVEG
ncbi:helix-turn-helix domain-containing protein [Spirosoma spitsbergense]|uniref:helix-turn-helix domain-containing protein n=1 Tax=Spirosoma spitsbergense TaxID=431554 RepID=UPI0003789E39|nr:AraC family transcriptional regulator [Spirosoma spitsbergense]